MADDSPEGPWGRAPSDHDLASAGLDKARAFLVARNADAAIREAEAVLARDPDGYWGYSALDLIGDAYTEKNDHTTVIKIGRELLALDPSRIEGYVHLACGALERDDMRTCIDAIERGLQCNPRSLALTILNSIRFRRAEDYPRAIEWAERAADMAPTHQGALNTLGYALDAAGRKADARRAFEEARALDPVGAYSVRTAAAIAFADGRYAEAQELALQALALDPQDVDASHIAFRARWFKSPLMRPYWAAHRLSKAQAALGAAVLLAAMAVLTPLNLARFVFPAIVVYYLGCMFVVLLIQALDDPSRPRKPPTLRDY